MVEKNRRYLLNIDWYLEHPLDFEYKNYVLLDYVQSVDKSFQIRKLSPYLLWTEKLLEEMRSFELRRLAFLKSVERTMLSFDEGSMRLVRKTISEPESMKVIAEIIEYSSPLLESKIKLGYKLLGKYPQLLF